MKGVFITATGTEVGKTWVARGLTRALVRRGWPVAPIKPIETDCQPHPADAVGLATAAGDPSWAHLPGLYRAAPPLAPAAIRDPATPDIASLCTTVEQAVRDRFAIVEGAGGILVPLNPTKTIADLISALGLPFLLVAKNELGVLSYALTAVEVALHRGLALTGVVLTPGAGDASAGSNAALLAERLSVPVVEFPICRDDDEQLGDAADHTGISDWF